MKIGYVRVSTAEQNEARQLERLRQEGVEKIYTEKISGKNMDRPKLREMLDFAREGDTIYIHDFSRISRNVADLLRLMEDLQQRGIELCSCKENLDTSRPEGRLYLMIIGAINEFERANLLERQREGIAIAKRKGKYKGGTRKKIEDIGKAYDDWICRRKTKAEIARENGISRPTLDRLLREYEQQNAK